MAEFNDDWMNEGSVDTTQDWREKEQEEQPQEQEQPQEEPPQLERARSARNEKTASMITRKKNERSLNKAGPLLKLPTGGTTNKFSWGSSPWQERDFVLDIKAGTLIYYTKGQGGFTKYQKGVLPLKGGVTNVLETLYGEPFAFELVTKDVTLKLAAASIADMDSWLVSLRASITKQQEPEKKLLLIVHNEEFVDSSTVSRKQEETGEAVERIRQMLGESAEIAVSTEKTLEGQSEQLAIINGDLNGLNGSINKAERNFDRLERWRIFGGRSSRLKKKKSSKKLLEDEPRAPFEQKRDNFEVIHGGKSTNLTQGLVGRDAEEKATLEEIANKDDEINEALDACGDLISSLGDAAQAIGDKARAQHALLETTQIEIDKSSEGVGRVNHRAAYNVKYLS